MSRLPKIAFMLKVVGVVGFTAMTANADAQNRTPEQQRVYEVTRAAVGRAASKVPVPVPGKSWAAKQVFDAGDRFQQNVGPKLDQFGRDNVHPQNCRGQGNVAGSTPQRCGN